MASKLKEVLLKEMKRLNITSLNYGIPGVSWAMRGMPDLAIFQDGGTTTFVEFKDPVGKKQAVQHTSDIQKDKHEKLRALGFRVFVVHSEIDLLNVTRWLIVAAGRAKE